MSVSTVSTSHVSFKDSRSEDPWSISRAKRAQKFIFQSFSWFSKFSASWTKTVASEIFAQNRLQHMTCPLPKSPHIELILAWTPLASVKNSSPKLQQNNYFATPNIPEFGVWFLASFTAGVCKINLQNNITCRIPSLQAILILKIRVARTLDHFQRP